MQIISLGSDYSGTGNNLGNISKAETLITNAGITDTPTKTALRAAYSSFRDSGLWDLMDKILLFQGTTASQQKWDLKNPVLAGCLTFMNDVVGAHTLNGYVGNATNIYAKTGYVPASPINHHLSAFNLTAESAAALSNNTGGILIGASNTGSNGYVARKYRPTSGNSAGVASTSGDLSVANLNNRIAPAGYDMTKTGLLTIVRRTTTDMELFDGSVSIGTSTFAPTPSAGTNEYYIGGLNSTGSAILLSGATISAVTIGKALSATQVSTLNSIILALNTAIGRA